MKIYGIKNGKKEYYGDNNGRNFPKVPSNEAYSFDGAIALRLACQINEFFLEMEYDHEKEYVEKLNKFREEFPNGSSNAHNWP